MGEVTVGGAEVVKNTKGDDAGVKKISGTRMRNVAKAYAWWIAKDVVNMSILKVTLALANYLFVLMQVLKGRRFYCSET